MAIGANSYGTVADVAALSRIWTDPTTKTYTTGTNPTLTSVESFIDQVSAIMNVTLADMGFTIPVTQADAKLSIASVINQIAADLCHAANSSGRFFSQRSLESSMSVIYQVRKEIRDWARESADGLQALGAARSVDGQTITMTGGVISLNFADHNEAFTDG
jgi:hypothetical protein